MKVILSSFHLVMNRQNRQNRELLRNTITMRLLPWDYGVRNLFRRPLRTALTAFGLSLVVFLLLLVIGFLRGLETALEQSGEPGVMLIHNVAAADNLENSS